MSLVDILLGKPLASSDERAEQIDLSTGIPIFVFPQNVRGFVFALRRTSTEVTSVPAGQNPGATCLRQVGIQIRRGEFRSRAARVIACTTLRAYSW